MLQIVTKMYFRQGVPLHSTVHREVLWTNRNFLRSERVDLPVGELAPSTGIEPASTVTVSITEHLEAEYPDGKPSMHIATSGTELIDDLADVLSFELNSIFSRDRDLVKRLVPSSLEAAGRESASKLFRDTFDPARYVPEEEINGLQQFMTQLLALERGPFEAAMRAIRRIVRATQRATTDPTLAYVDLVAALESLSEGADVPVLTWDRLDNRKRRLVDKALDGADPELVERVREAVMEAERLGSRSRFVAFVMASVSPDFFRAEAIGAVRPIRGADLERALKIAYDIRSLNVHVLEDLPPEAWVLGDRADTVSPPDLGLILSLEGLARLARHVVRSYVARAPAGVDLTFDWRTSLPGLLQMQVAPQYWIWDAKGFDHKSAERYFSGFVSHVIDTFAGRTDGIPDMVAVLEQIERLLPGTTEGRVKDILIAIYALWHRVLAPGDHRPRATEFLTEYQTLLERPGLPAFVVGLLSTEMPEWTDDAWHDLSTERREDRSRSGHLELPPSVDAALQVTAAERLSAAGRGDEARTLARFAVEELPGYEPLIAWEAGMVREDAPEIDLRALVLQVEPDAEPGRETTADPVEADADGPQPGDRSDESAPAPGDEHESDA